MIDGISIIIFITTIFLLWLYFKADSHIVELGNKIPGRKSLPIIGDLFSIPTSGPGGLRMRQELIKEYGHISRVWLGKILLVMISDPDDCEVILKSTKHIDKSFIYNFFHRWLGTGLLTSTGEKWHTRRKAITPTFHFKILEQFISTFDYYGDMLVDILSEHCDGPSFNVQPLISRYTLDVICKTAMGTEVHAQKNNSSYVIAVRRICNLISDRMRKPWLHSNIVHFLSGRKWKEDALLKIIEKHTDKIIKEKTEQLHKEDLNSDSNEDGVKMKIAFLEQLIKMKMQGCSAIQSDKDITEEVNTFMFEGHDTTTAAICFTLFLLSRHYDIQEKVYAELKDLMENHEGKCITYESLQMMKYLECVIKESLRIHPSVSVIARQINEDLYLPSGYTAPAGSTLFINLYSLHRHEKHFENPLVFNPDNFLNGAKRHPYAYLPFSAGPRNCIGQKFAMLELKSVLSKIILNFKIEKNDDANWDIIEDPNIVLQSLSGHRIRLKRRV